MGGVNNASRVPLISFAQAGTGGVNNAGFPVGQGIKMTELPAVTNKNTYALQVQGVSMLPFNRDGNKLFM
jgi:phage repressor protein C with HTH and peptisase S24 domain